MLAFAQLLACAESCLGSPCGGVDFLGFFSPFPFGRFYFSTPPAKIVLCQRDCWNSSEESFSLESGFSSSYLEHNSISMWNPSKARFYIKSLWLGAQLYIWAHLLWCDFVGWVKFFPLQSLFLHPSSLVVAWCLPFSPLALLPTSPRPRRCRALQTQTKALICGLVCDLLFLKLHIVKTEQFKFHKWNACGRLPRVLLQLYPNIQFS